MSLIIAGYVRLDPEVAMALRPQMQAVISATRQEDGCLGYTYGEDVHDPGLIQVFEHWRDQAALDAHLKSAHMATWRGALMEAGVTGRQLVIYEAGAERPM